MISSNQVGIVGGECGACLKYEDDGAGTVGCLGSVRLVTKPLAPQVHEEFIAYRDLQAKKVGQFVKLACFVAQCCRDAVAPQHAIDTIARTHKMDEWRAAWMYRVALTCFRMMARAHDVDRRLTLTVPQPDEPLADIATFEQLEIVCGMRDEYGVAAGEYAAGGARGPDQLMSVRLLKHQARMLGLMTKGA
jgi:hypothetical protein